MKLVLRDTQEWIATVHNFNKRETYIVALDKCHVDTSKIDINMKRCDGLLYVKHQWLALVELKNQRTGAVPEAIEQLQNTISRLDQEEVSLFSLRCAYVANKAHKTFSYSRAGTMQDFFNRTKFRLIITATIHVP